MRISVITVVLDPDETFCLTAESILNQDYSDVEWIVIDGHGASAGYTYLDRYRDDMDIFVSEPDNGVYFTMNSASQLATGDWVVFLNAGDVFYRADTLSRLYPYLRNGGDIVYGDHDYVGSGLHLFRKAAAASTLLAQLKQGDLSHEWHSRMPCHQATYYRRSLLTEISFDTRYRIAADHDLFLRAAKEGRALIYVNQTLCRYAAGGFSARSASRCHAEWVDIYSRHSDYSDAVRRQIMGNQPNTDAAAVRGCTIIAGAYEREGPYPAERLPRFNWVMADGLYVVVDQSCGAPVLHLTGRALLRQDLTIMLGEEKLAVVTLVAGRFTHNVSLSRPLARGDLLMLRGSAVDSLSPTDMRSTGWAIFEIALEKG